MTRMLRAVFAPCLALGGAFVVSAVVIALAGHNPWHALGAVVDEAFGSLDGLSEVGVKTCPLLLCGLAVTVAFRAGAWNIGVEGQLLMGALAMAGLGTRAGQLPAAVDLGTDLLVAAALGAMWAGIAGQLKVRRETSEVISTIMLNFVALALVSYAVQGPLMEAGGRYPQTDAILPGLRLPRLVPPLRIHLGLVIALVFAGGLQLLLFRTVVGYEMRAAGASRQAARLAGINVEQRLLLALMLSGALAGLAGAIEVSAMTHRLYERFSPGWGFTAIAVALLGRLSPAGVVVAAFFFGALDSASNALQRVAGVSSVLVPVIQATVILFLVGLERVRWSGQADSSSGA